MCLVLWGFLLILSFYLSLQVHNKSRNGLNIWIFHVLQAAHARLENYFSPDNFTSWLLGVSLGFSAEMGAERGGFSTAPSRWGLGREPGYGRASTARGGDCPPSTQAATSPEGDLISGVQAKCRSCTQNRFVSAPDSIPTSSPLHPFHPLSPSPSPGQIFIINNMTTTRLSLSVNLSHLNHCLAFPSWHFHRFFCHPLLPS